jgi:hypothetical protein
MCSRCRSAGIPRLTCGFNQPACKCALLSVCQAFNFTFIRPIRVTSAALCAARQRLVLTINWEPQEKCVLFSVGMAVFTPSARARDAQAAIAECLDNPLGLCRRLGGRRA